MSFRLINAIKWIIFLKKNSSLAIPCLFLKINLILITFFFSKFNIFKVEKKSLNFNVNRYAWLKLHIFYFNCFFFHFQKLKLNLCIFLLKIIKFLEFDIINVFPLIKSIIFFLFILRHKLCIKLTVKNSHLLSQYSQ